MADNKDAKFLQDLLKYQKELNISMSKSTDIQDKIKFNEELISNQKRIQNEYQEASKLSKKEISNFTDEEKKSLNDIINKEKEINSELDKQVKRRQRNIDLVKQIGTQLKNGWKYLQDQDKIIKSVNLNLGMSGAKAAAMRDSFNKSAGYVTMLGGSLADIQSIMQGYADETGRAHVLSAEMVKNITDIGKGTGLGVEQATRLGAQFELMGVDAKATMNYVQGVVDTSERMGVNTTKVLKVVNDNFKRLNTYTFQQGVKGFAEMAMYAEKFKIDINQALNAADVARSLEGAVDLAAQLQVMGGEFAKTDPFQMLFLSRNDPAKFTEKIADMTKGLVTFRKMSDGTFEKFISPADRDRLAAVAKSLGMEASALTEVAERTAEIEKMRSNMSGTGFSKDVKEALEGAGKMNSETGKFQVKLGITMMNITDLTKEQAESFLAQQVLLKDRAKEALTFDETFKATINSLKTTLLPLLNGVNQILSATSDFLKPAIDWLKKGDLAWAKVAGLFITAGLLWKGLLQPLAGRIGAGTVGRVGSAIRGTRGLSNAIPTPEASGSQLLGAGKGAGAASKGLGAARAGTGAAAAGMGAGILLAGKGIKEMAEGMAMLDKTQIWALPATMLALSASFLALTPAITAAGAAGTVSSVGLLAIGGAITLIGGGVYLATSGIGKMAEGFGEMFTALKDVKNLKAVTNEVSGLMDVLKDSRRTLKASKHFGEAIAEIGKNGKDIEKVGAAFKQIQTVMSGSRDDFIAVQNAVESISNMNTKGGGMLADLAKLLKKPLEVKFSKNDKLSMVNDITLQIDKTTFMHKIYDAKIAVQMHENLRTNK